MNISNANRLLRHIVKLEKRVGAFAPKAFFNPRTFSLPEKDNLVTLDEETIQQWVNEMACFMGLPFYKIAVVAEWQKSGVGGHIRGSGANTQNTAISIDPDLRRHPLALMKVLSHELSHKYLSFHHLDIENTSDDEILTDVAAIYLGFGKFALNGGAYSETYWRDWQTKVTRTVRNGYLNQEETAFVYDVVCRMRGIRGWAVFKGLNTGAVKSIMLERLWHAGIYPPAKPDLSPIKAMLESIRGKQESTDLELCNIEKIKLLFPSALATRADNIHMARSVAVNNRHLLRLLEEEVVAPFGQMACPGMPVWKEDSENLLKETDKCLATARALNKFVSGRVPPDVTSANWDAQSSIIIECPSCAGRLRLPTGKTGMTVTCPRCKYAFSYSTNCPDFQWVKPSPFREIRSSRLKGVVVGIRKWGAEVWNGLVAKTRRLPPWVGAVSMCMGFIVAIFMLVAISAEVSNKGKREEDARHEVVPYPQSGKVRILDEDLFRVKLNNANGDSMPLSPFKITTPKGSYYLIKLVESGGKTPIMDIFCHPGETIETIVPDGSYEARMASGKIWYGYDYLFGASTVYQRMDTILRFEQGSGHHVTLEKVANGNLPTTDIDGEDF